MSIANFLPDHMPANPSNNEPQTMVSLPAFALTGFAARTTNAAEFQPGGQIPGLWRTYYQSGLPLDSGICDPHLIYALYTDYESDASGAYTLVIGHQSAVAEEGAPIVEKSLIADGAEPFRALIPDSRYRIFRTRTGPIAEVVAETWGEIWAYYEQSSERRAYTGDFELYDTRNFDPEAAEVQIYIAIS